MSTRPQQGQIWERDGLRREVVEVNVWVTDTGTHDDAYSLFWTRPGRSALFRCWRSTWERWASKATLVRERFGVEA